MKRIAFISLITLCLLPASAQAATRFTSPSGGDADPCTRLNPCSLYTGVTGAADSDTVKLAPGTHYLDAAHTPLDITHAISIEGGGQSSYADTPTEIVFREASDGGDSDAISKLRLFDQGISISKVSIYGRSDLNALVGAGSNNDGASYDRVRIVNTGATDTLIGNDVSLTNSIVGQTGAGSLGSATEISGTIEGSLIYSFTGTAVSFFNTYHPTPFCSLTIRNTMARGGGRNLKENDTGSGGSLCPTLALSYDHSWIASSGSGGGISYAGLSAPLDGGNNLANTPDLFDPTTLAGGLYVSFLLTPSDFSTVNAGCTAGCPDHDFYGRPRPIGAASDIGPMEQGLPAVVTAPAVSSVSKSGATITSNLKPEGENTTYKIQIRKVGAADWADVATGDSADNIYAAKTVTGTASGLEAATDYQTQIVATSYRGTTTSPATAFKTSNPDPSPDPGPTPDPAATLTVTKVKSTVKGKKAYLTTTLSVNQAGKITQKATAKKKTWCKANKTVGAGSVTVTCKLSKKGRKYLKKKSLKLTLVTTFTPTGKSAIVKTSKITVKKKR